MMTFTEPASAPSAAPAPFTDRLRLAVAAYLARFKGSSRKHTESDLRCYLAWCAEQRLDPLAAQQPHLELFSCGRGTVLPMRVGALCIRMLIYPYAYALT
jgi:hypothetical protein